MGKTAYARGQLLIGSMNDSLEEIYGVSDEPYDIDNRNFALNSPPDGEPALTNISGCKFSQDGNYCVRWGYYNDNGNHYVIESFAINDDGLYYQASKNATTDEVVYKKYRYTFEELGIVNSEGKASSDYIQDIAFGCAGFGSEANKCVLAISYYVDNTPYLKLLTYHLSDNGIIGKAYENETTYIDTTIQIQIHNQKYFYYKKLVGDLNNPLVFYGTEQRYSTEWQIFLDKIVISQMPSNGGVGYIVNFYEGQLKTHSTTKWNPTILQITENDNYCYLLSYSSATYTPSKGIIWKITDSNEPTYITSTDNLMGISEKNDKVYIFKSDSTDLHIHELQNSSISSDYKSATLTTYSNCNLTGNAVVTVDERFISSIGIANSGYFTKYYILVHDLDELLNAEDEYIVPKQEFLYSGNNFQAAGGNMVPHSFYVNRNTSRIFKATKTQSSYTLISAFNAENSEDIIAVKYKNQYFSKVEPQTLSAGGSDVRAGKTFIGWMGYPETGTMEV